MCLELARDYTLEFDDYVLMQENPTSMNSAVNRMKQWISPSFLEQFVE